MVYLAELVPLFHCVVYLCIEYGQNVCLQFLTVEAPLTKDQRKSYDTAVHLW